MIKIFNGTGLYTLQHKIYTIGMVHSGTSTGPSDKPTPLSNILHNPLPTLNSLKIANQPHLHYTPDAYNLHSLYPTRPSHHQFLKTLPWTLAQHLHKNSILILLWAIMSATISSQKDPPKLNPPVQFLSKTVYVAFCTIVRQIGTVFTQTT